MPTERKEPFTRPKWSRPKEWREALGDGNFGGPYQLSDDDVLRVWNAAVETLRERLASGWP
jgi:creatinine amidohydrolase